MKKIIKKYQALALFPLAFSAVNIALAENSMEHVVVTTTRSELESVTVPIGVVVISKDDIKSSGAQSVASIINNKAGIQLSDFFGDGSRTQVSLRGFAETANANVLILVDGRRLNNTDIGAPDLNSISLEYVERIEILQGGASTLYGDQAVAGVINIITSDPEDFYIGVDLSVGSYDRQQISLNVGQAFDNGLSYKASVNTRESDNYRDHNNSEYDNLYVKSVYQYQSGKIFLELQSIDDFQQTPGALLFDELNSDREQSAIQFENDFTQVDTDIIRLGFEQKINDHWKFISEYTDREADGEFRLNFRSCINSTCDGPISVQDRNLKTFNPRFVSDYDAENGTFLFTIGMDYEESDYFLSTTFGTQDNEQETTSLYVQSVLPITKQATLTLGLRNASLENDLIDRPSFGSGVPDDADLDDNVRVFNIGFNIKPNDNLRYFFRYEENYRFAKVDDNTQSPVLFGGNVLETQEGKSTDIGFDWNTLSLGLTATLFKLDLDNEITFNPNTFQTINIGSTSRSGITLDGNYQLGKKLKLGTNFSYIDAEIKSGDFSGNEVPFVAAKTFSLNASYQVIENLNIYAEANYISDRFLSGDFANSFDKLPSYTVVNLNMSYSVKSWSVSALINNLFDKNYSSFASTGFDESFNSVRAFLPSPERNFVLSGSYYFK